MPKQPAELIEFLAPYPPDVQALALKGRDVLLKKLEPVNEIFYDACTAVCSGFTYTDKVTDNFVNLAVYSDHVTLIFPYGVNLNDKQSRLKGNGTRVRHIRLVTIETLTDPYVQDLVTQASQMAIRPAKPVKPQAIVKVMSGAKRRPKSA